jgi:hypothetical protein
MLKDGSARIHDGHEHGGDEHHADRDLLADARAHGLLKLRRVPQYSGRA